MAANPLRRWSASSWCRGRSRRRTAPRTRWGAFDWIRRRRRSVGEHERARGRRLRGGVGAEDDAAVAPSRHPQAESHRLGGIGLRPPAEPPARLLIPAAMEPLPIATARLPVAAVDSPSATPSAPPIAVVVRPSAVSAVPPLAFVDAPKARLAGPLAVVPEPNAGPGVAAGERVAPERAAVRPAGGGRRARRRGCACRRRPCHRPNAVL